MLPFEHEIEFIASLEYLACTAIDFVEVEFPRFVTPRLVLQFSEGISILLEKPTDIALASELVAAIRTHLDSKGGRSC